MGLLHYGGLETIEIDDWVLRHLQAVMHAKLQRHESFAFHWQIASMDGSGHASIWITQGVALSFRFQTASRQPLNREWLSMLMACASESGLRVLPEPERNDDDRLSIIGPRPAGAALRTGRGASGASRGNRTRIAVASQK